MANVKKFRSLQHFANTIARREGYQKATEIIIGDSNSVVNHTNFGYRKYTTGEYVSNSYVNNFGWKNTYYQSAETTVSVKQEIFNFFK